MANVFEPTEELRKEWEEWLNDPEYADTREVAAKLPPWKLYRMKSTGQRVTLRSIGLRQDGTPCARVFVDARYNFVTMEREVFGIPVDDLEECELPAPGELVGSMEMPVEVARELLREDKAKEN